MTRRLNIACTAELFLSHSVSDHEVVCDPEKIIGRLINRRRHETRGIKSHVGASVKLVVSIVKSIGATDSLCNKTRHDINTPCFQLVVRVEVARFTGSIYNLGSHRPQV